MTTYAKTKKEKEQIEHDVEWLYKQAAKTDSLRMKRGDVPQLIDDTSFSWAECTGLDAMIARSIIETIYAFSLKGCAMFADSLCISPVCQQQVVVGLTGLGKTATREYLISPLQEIIIQAMSSITGKSVKDCRSLFTQSNSLPELVKKLKDNDGMIFLDIDEFDNFLEKTKKNSEFRELYQASTGSK